MRSIWIFIACIITICVLIASLFVVNGFYIYWHKIASNPSCYQLIPDRTVTQLLGPQNRPNCLDTIYNYTLKSKDCSNLVQDFEVEDSTKKWTAEDLLLYVFSKKYCYTLINNALKQNADTTKRKNPCIANLKQLMSRFLNKEEEYIETSTGCKTQLLYASVNLNTLSTHADDIFFSLLTPVCKSTLDVVIKHHPQGHVCVDKAFKLAHHSPSCYNLQCSGDIDKDYFQSYHEINKYIFITLLVLFNIIAVSIILGATAYVRKRCKERNAGEDLEEPRRQEVQDPRSREDDTRPLLTDPEPTDPPETKTEHEEESEDPGPSQPVIGTATSTSDLLITDEAEHCGGPLHLLVSQVPSQAQTVGSGGGFPIQSLNIDPSDSFPYPEQEREPGSRYYIVPTGQNSMNFGHHSASAPVGNIPCANCGHIATSVRGQGQGQGQGQCQIMSVARSLESSTGSSTHAKAYFSTNI